MNKQLFFDRLFYAGIVIVSAIVMGLLLVTNESLKAPLDPAEAEVPERYTAFSDVPTDHDAHEAIYALVRKGVLVGYPDRTFRPDEVSRRADTLKMLLAISPLESSDIFEMYHNYVQQNPDLEFFLFPDITADSWFAPYILKAVRLGLVKGNPTGDFEAGRPVTYAEFLKMLFVLEREQIGTDDEAMSPFDGVSPYMWYTPYFVRAKAIGLLPLDSKEYVNPSEELSRGKIARLLFQYFQLRGKQGR